MLLDSLLQGFKKNLQTYLVPVSKAINKSAFRRSNQILSIITAALLNSAKNPFSFCIPGFNGRYEIFWNDLPPGYSQREIRRDLRCKAMKRKCGNKIHHSVWLLSMNPLHHIDITQFCMLGHEKARHNPDQPSCAFLVIKSPARGGASVLPIQNIYFLLLNKLYTNERICQ